MRNCRAQHQGSVPLSWLQSSNGQWRYLTAQYNQKPIKSATTDQDYIWLVTQTSPKHKVSGYRIANWQLEGAIKQLAGVNQVLVFGIPHEQKGNAIHVYIERVNQKIDTAILAMAVNAKLASSFGAFVRADVIQYVDQLPDVSNPVQARQRLKAKKLIMKLAA
ncbi:acetyl-CoA synthetase [Colwellia chukchiensis]|uniref:Acetyl-CoA synthetase n=1 Tax=Colwellia chukchiensis TaxID=641665 RepID=A0A1H7PEA2_9GAMM|nr:hypothetical protein [Colwellia chukchiensis]SEL34100.1 acetyl-CoA synthetase [Colwellia chukchiensis]